MPRLRLLPPVTVANTAEEAVPVLEQLMNRGGSLAIDTETTGLRPLDDSVLFWSMATEDARYCFHKNLLEIFQPLFRRKDVSWYLANAKFDMHMLANHGILLHGDVKDIVVMDAMEDDTRAHGLKEQCELAYEAKWGDFKELFLDPDFVGPTIRLDRASFIEFKRRTVGEKLLIVYNERPDIVEDYASCDAYFTYLRGQDLTDQLGAIELPTDPVDNFTTLLDYFNVIEVPLTKYLWEMERNGFDIDLDYVDKIDRPMRDGIEAAKRKIAKAAGKDFNPRSNDELRDILFSKAGFGLRPIGYTAGGKSEPKAKTDEQTLKILLSRMTNGTPEHRFLLALLDYRHLVKLHGTYVKNIRKHIGKDGRVHCKINQSGARTSRMSASNPNMQNIPSRNDPFKIRGAFTAGSGELLIDLDYPQIEFRIAAVLAEEEKMCQLIRDGWDIHSGNAANMYKDATYEGIQEARRKKDAGEPLTDIDRRMLRYRDGAKTVGLGTLYGEGAKKMADQLGISYDAAQELIDTFFTTYPNIDLSICEQHVYAHEHEMTHTMLGRIRRLHTINSDKGGLVAAGERQAYNTLIQGSGAEMMKLAILRVGASKEFRELGGKLVLTVHDELISRGPADTANDIMEVKKELMAHPYHWGPIQFTYPVPIPPDGSTAFRWSEAK